jgi:hypothetical protein
MPPGSSDVTRMPSGATSVASTAEKPAVAHFALWYADSPGVAIRLPTEVTLMMCPPPCSRRIGSAALVVCTVPKNTVSI